MVVAEFRTDSGNNVKVYSDGDVYINGRMDSKIYPDGEIWSYGKIIAKIYPDGEIWSGGCKVGRIYSDGEIWVGSTCVARANGGYSGNGNDTSYSNNTDDYSLSDVDSRKQKTHSATGIAVGGSMLENSDGIGCVAIPVLIFLVIDIIATCFWVWPMFISHMKDAKTSTDYFEIVWIFALIITSMIIQYRLNCKDRGGFGFFINFFGMLVGLGVPVYIEDSKTGIDIGLLLVASALFAAVPTVIVASISWGIKKIKNSKKSN